MDYDFYELFNKEVEEALGTDLRDRSIETTSSIDINVGTNVLVGIAVEKISV